MSYKELNVLTQFPEFADEILLAHGALSVTLVDAADNPVLEPAPGETPLWLRTRTVGLFEEGAELDGVIRALRETLPDGATAVVTTAQLADKDWIRIWLRDWKPLRFGERLWVTPHAKRKQIRQRDAVIVTLDPGLAFGTGTHPTTALCLEWLARADLKGKTVLDYGCGSGLLAIAALKLGARAADGVDIDPQAMLASRDNATKNGVARRLRVHAAAAFKPKTYDIVLANILSGPLVALAPRLMKALKPGGALVLAGLLEKHAAEVRAAYAQTIEWNPGKARDGWERLDGRSVAKAAGSRSRAGKARPTRAGSARRPPSRRARSA